MDKRINLKVNIVDEPLPLKTELPDPVVPLDLSRRPRRGLKALLYLAIFVITSLAVFSTGIVVSKQSSTTWFGQLPIIKQIRNFAESADRTLKGEESDRINILLLGMGGKDHDGGYLTDTIMLVSLEPSTQKIALVSIPRDLAVPLENKGWQKINAVNAYAEAENKNSGGLAISQAVSKVFNLPIDYYVRVDFAGFINIVNELGGLNVYVDNTLDDYSYPVMGQEDAYPYESRFEHLHVEKGWQKMDGDLALKFARSRHGSGGEGSDFARARRQQKILEALRDSVLNVYNIFKPKMIANILEQFNDHLSTNLQIWEVLKLWDLFKDAPKANIVNQVIDNSANGLLIDSITEDGAYILAPRSGDFAEIQYFVTTIFNEGPRDIKSILSSEKAKIEVRNGTWVNGLASKAALDLEKLGFTIVRVGNNSSQRFERSVIYDLTYGEKERSLTVLKNRTGANISYGIPDWLAKEIKADIERETKPIQPDFILILGQDADKSRSGTTNPDNQP